MAVYVFIAVLDNQHLLKPAHEQKAYYSIGCKSVLSPIQSQINIKENTSEPVKNYTAFISNTYTSNGSNREVCSSNSTNCSFPAQYCNGMGKCHMYLTGAGGKYTVRSNEAILGIPQQYKST